MDKKLYRAIYGRKRYSSGCVHEKIEQNKKKKKNKNSKYKKYRSMGYTRHEALVKSGLMKPKIIKSELEIKGKPKYLKYLKGHLEKEHPETKGKIREEIDPEYQAAMRNQV